MSSTKLRLELDEGETGKARVLVKKTTAEALHTIARHLRLPIDEVLRLSLSRLASHNGWTISFNGKRRRR